jgi:hypothetical protein
VERVSGHPLFQGCKRREASAGGRPCVHEPDLFWLWRTGLQRLVGALACLPRLWHEPAQRP